MAFDVIASSYQERETERSALGHTIIVGISFGGIAIFSALVGILYMFHQRWIVAYVPADAADPTGLTLGQTLLVVFAMWGATFALRKTREQRLAVMCLQGAAVGAVGGAMLSVLPIIMSQVKLRFMFISLTDQLFDMLTSGMGLGAGIAVLVGGGAVAGAFGALLYGIGPRVRRPIVYGLAWLTFVGLFQELIQLLGQFEALDVTREWFFTWDGLRPQGALAIALAAAAIIAVWDANRERLEVRFGALPEKRQRVLRGGGLALLLFVVLIIFPLVSGNFIGQVLLFIGLFILMGMGLNLEIGLAGLLDLGFCRLLRGGCLYLRAADRGQPPRDRPAFRLVSDVQLVGGDGRRGGGLGRGRGAVRGAGAQGPRRLSRGCDPRPGRDRAGTGAFGFRGTGVWGGARGAQYSAALSVRG